MFSKDEAVHTRRIGLVLIYSRPTCLATDEMRRNLDRAVVNTAMLGVGTGLF